MSELDAQVDLQRRFGGLARLYGVAGAAAIRGECLCKVVDVQDSVMDLPWMNHRTKMILTLFMMMSKL